MRGGLRYSANEKKKEKYYSFSVEERQKKYYESKKRRNLKCKKCKKLISYGNKSGLCQGCFQTEVWKDRKKEK